MERFCHLLPKIELHAHLHGSFRQSSIEKLSGENFPPVGTRNVKACWQIFDLMYRSVDSLEKVSTLTLEVLEDFAAQNCVYLELRSTPRVRIQGGWSKRAYIDCVLGVLSKWNSESGLRLQARLILSIDRGDTLENALDTVQLACEYYHATHLVLGVDFCGNPLKSSFSAFEAAFQEARALGLKTTVHCAETEAEEDTARILAFAPDRLGHCCAMSDLQLRALCDELRIPVEVCLTSNLHTIEAASSAETRAAAADSHALSHFLAAALPLALCTDDTAVFGNTLSSEYADVAAYFSLTQAQMFEMAAGAIDLIFDEAYKVKLREIFAAARASQLD